MWPWTRLLGWYTPLCLDKNSPRCTPNFEVPSFIRSEGRTGTQNLKGHMTQITRLLGVICYPCALGLAVVNLCIKFEVYNSTRYKDRKGDIKYRQEAQLSQRGRATHYVIWNLVSCCIVVRKIAFEKACSRWILVNISCNICYISWGIGVKKVSNSKADLQGHSRSLVLAPFDRQHAISS